MGDTWFFSAGGVFIGKRLAVEQQHRAWELAQRDIEQQAYLYDLAQLASLSHQTPEEIDAAIEHMVEHARAEGFHCSKRQTVKILLEFWAVSGGQATDYAALLEHTMAETMPAPQGNRAQRRHPEKKTQEKKRIQHGSYHI